MVEPEKIQTRKPTIYSEACIRCGANVIPRMPGAVYQVNTKDTSVTVAIHNTPCRGLWFRDNLPSKWVIMYRIGYEEEQ